jgi:hypothetical protein
MSRVSIAFKDCRATRLDGALASSREQSKGATTNVYYQPAVEIVQEFRVENTAAHAVRIAVPVLNQKGCWTAAALYSPKQLDKYDFGLGAFEFETD